MKGKLREAQRPAQHLSCCELCYYYEYYWGPMPADKMLSFDEMGLRENTGLEVGEGYGQEKGGTEKGPRALR